MQQKSLLNRIFLFLFIIFVCSLGSAVVLFFYVQRQDIISDLTAKANRINEELSFNQGEWNLETYNKDSEILGSYPLYLITVNGFILDRRSVITGFLDKSDYKNLLNYQNLQTITTIAGGSRRILSKPIYDGKEIIGVISVSYFNPAKENISNIDKELIINQRYLSSKVFVKNHTLDVKSVDEKKLSYNITFLIVDKYNSVLLKTTNVNNVGRIPSYIDPSYIQVQLTKSDTQFVMDQKTGEWFLVHKKLIKDKVNLVLGIIVIGKSINKIVNMIKIFTLYYSVICLILFAIAYLFIYLNFKTLLRLLNPSMASGDISFDDKQGLLCIGDTKINILYATNQYYLLQALFSNPSKRWETDELLDRFGELDDLTSVRKVYDASININKRVVGYLRERLIIIQNKTYQLNPKLPVIKSSK